MEGGENVGGGLRKGAWTEDEDRLLRRCIETYGEGRWHQVPIRAGLNRCRKSCRLRWLNYLKPNIKRGEFSDDEVDLITRLHKLLGNRWSLIAGRLPGRTANDVKNYWNTHQKKKMTITFPCKQGYINNGRQQAAGGIVTKKINSIQGLQITKTNIIKPRPRTFSSNSLCWPMKPAASKKPITTSKPNNNYISRDDHHHYQENHDDGAGVMWADKLERFLNDSMNDRSVGDMGCLEADHIPLNQLMSSILPDHNEKSINMMTFQEDNYQSLWSDVDISHLLSDHHDI